MLNNEHGKHHFNKHAFLPVAFCLVGAILFIIVSALLYWPAPEIAFRTDDSPVAWLSSAQLWAMAILCLRLWQDKALPRYLCIWLCIAMMGMSFDEQFMLHEHWKYHCLEWLSLCSHTWVTELPMLLVAIFGSVTGLLLHRNLNQSYQRSLLWGAISIGLFALYLRFLQKPIDLLPYKAAFLVIAEALFTGLLLSLPRKNNGHVHSP
ncbi:hypothetical protein ACO0K9_19780 [Undibacterium sp. Ji50W]|uniref:hypothetical protein n=1 Tax=Undibacterium sp. Ji50W TaxID=3413041 RepID=UPI003BF2345D